MSLQDLAGQLDVLDSHQGLDHVRNFEAVVAEIAALQDPSSIELLCGYFDDHAPYNELMFSIIHTIEAFPAPVYVAHLLGASPRLCEKAPRWASIIFMRMLNVAEDRLQLVRQLRNSPQNVKDAVRHLMEKINMRHVEFIPKTMPVIVAAG